MDKKRISHEGSLSIGIGWVAAAIFLSGVIFWEQLERRIDCALDIKAACIKIEQEYIVNE